MAEPTVEATGATIDWQRLHPITPLLNAWKFAAAIVAVGLWQAQDIDFGELDLTPLIIVGIVLGIVVLGAVVGLVAGYLSWRRTSYAISDESVYLHQGVIFRKERHVRLDRIQAVEIAQPLLARIFGYAALKVESAGGLDSSLRLEFLTQADAHTVRAEILARAAGIKVAKAARPGSSPGSQASSQSGAHPGIHPQHAGNLRERLREFTPELADSGGYLEAPEQPVLQLAVGRHVGSLALSSTLLASVAIAAFLVVPDLVSSGANFTSFGAIVPLVGAFGFVWNRFSSEFNFRAAISSDGLRIRQGLLETRARTIPPGRVQAIQAVQPLFWRKPDWWRLQVNVAGFGAEIDGTETTVLYPVARGREVNQMVALILPDFGVANPNEVLDEALRGVDNSRGFTTSPRRARWINPLVWRRTGYFITETAVIFRIGRLTRRIIIVPHARIQSMSVSHGPLMRKLDLAEVALHSTIGPVTPRLHGMAADDAAAFLVAENDRARRARASAGPEKWMQTRPTYTGILPASPRLVLADPQAPAYAPGHEPAQGHESAPAQDPTQAQEPAPGHESASGHEPAPAPAPAQNAGDFAEREGSEG